MKTITNPHVPTKVDYLPENPTSICAKCDKKIEQFTWYDDDCGWRTDSQWHYLTWEDRPNNIKVGIHHYECVA